MASKALSNYITKDTPVTEQVDPAQVKNSAGGFVFTVDSWQSLRRFLVLGSEGGSYYASERKLTTENVKNLAKLVESDGKRVVDEVVAISSAGRAPKNDYAIFALAYCGVFGSPEVKGYAYAHLKDVCRIGTHLFQFAEFVKNLRNGGSSAFGGSGIKRAVGSWYTERSADSLAYQLVKYRQRNGWTHRDMLRLAHVKPDAAHADLLAWAAGKGASEHPTIMAFNEIQAGCDPKRALELVTAHRLPWEALPDALLGSADIWTALLPHMGMTAMIRQLPRLTRLGLFAPLSSTTKFVSDALGDVDRLKRERVHPISVLIALKTYASGEGFRGSSTWEPNQKIVDALDDAFYLSFGAVEPANKRTLVGVDVSGSMEWGNIAGTNITPRVASAAMAMLIARTEPDSHVVGFSHKIVPLAISPKMRLDAVLKVVDDTPMGGTDCALLFDWARSNRVEVDTFITLTDSETWAGDHPHLALKKYRKGQGINSRSVVVGMVANDFTIADPKDPGMLDVVGFDTATPNLMSSFSRGEF